MSKASGLAIVMIFLAVAPGWAQTARGNSEQSTQARALATVEAASLGVQQIDAAGQMDQARLAMMAGDYIAAEAHIKSAVATAP